MAYVLKVNLMNGEGLYRTMDVKATKLGVGRIAGKSIRYGIMVPAADRFGSGVHEVYYPAHVIRSVELLEAE